jgi:N-acetylglucosamine-6-phosphate deacetylase
MTDPINSNTLFTNARVVAANGDPATWLLVKNDQIADFGAGDPPPEADAVKVDANGAWLLPGYIDLHVHGAVGCDTMDAKPESLLAMARFFARRGVTTFLPTTMTASHDAILRALHAVRDLVNQPTGGARIFGVHLEGPYINHAMPGAQNPTHVRLASRPETRELLALDVIRRITLAPEYPENQQLISDAASQGISLSAGHTQATPDDLRTAIKLGLRFTTHTFNAMIGLHHRNPGTVGGALAFDELTCELIPDGIHVHPLVMKILIRAKGLSRVVLITDAMAGAGMPDGQYDLGGLAVTVGENQARLTEGGALAGSVLTLDRGVYNAHQVADIPFPQGWVISSDNAAQSLGLRAGRIERGYNADLILVDDVGVVQRTLVGGETVFAHGEMA